MKLSTLGAITAALAVSAVAGAQTSSYQTIGADLRIGAFFPVDSKTIDRIGDGFVAFGVDYRLDPKLPRFFGFEKTHLSLSVDYFAHDNYGNLPVLLNYVVDSGQFFFQVGAGVGFEDLPSRDKAGFAYEAALGYNIPSTSRLPIFLQAEFFGSDRSEVNGIGAFVGVKF